MVVEIFKKYKKADLEQARRSLMIPSLFLPYGGPIAAIAYPKEKLKPHELKEWKKTQKNILRATLIGALAGPVLYGRPLAKRFGRTAGFVGGALAGANFGGMLGGLYEASKSDKIVKENRRKRR